MTGLENTRRATNADAESIRHLVFAPYTRHGFRPDQPPHLSKRCNGAYFLDLRPA